MTIQALIIGAAINRFATDGITFLRDFSDQLLGEFRRQLPACIRKIAGCAKRFQKLLIRSRATLNQANRSFGDIRRQLFAPHRVGQLRRTTLLIQNRVQDGGQVHLRVSIDEKIGHGAESRGQVDSSNFANQHRLTCGVLRLLSQGNEAFRRSGIADLPQGLECSSVQLRIRGDFSDPQNHGNTLGNFPDPGYFEGCQHGFIRI